MNIFEQAARGKIRFSSVNGLLTTEQLFGCTLDRLDTIGRQIMKERRELGEEDSLIHVNRTSAARAELDLKLEIVKHIIDAKQTKIRENENASAKAAEIELLKETLAEKKIDQVKSLSEEEILKRIEQIKNAS